MKKSSVTSLLLLVFVLLSYTSSIAQSNDFEIGVGLAYGGEADNIGISVDGYYNINEQFRAGAAFTYFFPDNDFNHYAIDFNGNYIFYNDQELMAYAIAGLNIFSRSVDDTDISNSELGLNLGAGLEYGLDFADLFGELKFAGIGGDYDQLVLGAGLRFTIN